MNPVRVGVSTHDDFSAGSRVDRASSNRRWPISYRSIEVTACILDVIIIVGTSVLTSIAYNLFAFGSSRDLEQPIAAAAVVCALVIPALKLRAAYRPTALLTWTKQFRDVVLIWTGALLFLAAVFFALKVGPEFSRGATLSFAALGLFGLLAHRVFWRTFIEKALSDGSLRGRNVILIWDRPPRPGSKLGAELLRYGFQIQRSFTLRGSPASSPEHVLNEAITYARSEAIDEIFVVCDLQHWALIGPLLDQLRILPLPICVVPDNAAAELIRRPSHQLGASTIIEFQRAPLTWTEYTIKRLMDISVSATGLTIFAPLLACAAIAVKCDSRGPVLFRQTRHGFNGKPFKILKFRTMKVLEDGDNFRQAKRNDDRITRVGTWLRKTSIDELPQLLNVFKGDMSIVGPRPHAVAMDSHFAKLIENYAFRHHVKPGMTGWAQVNGFRGETPTLESMERRIELDTWYVDNWSVWLDCSIILRTAGEIVRGHNAY